MSACPSVTDQQQRQQQQHNNTTHTQNPRQSTQEPSRVKIKDETSETKDGVAFAKIGSCCGPNEIRCYSDPPSPTPCIPFCPPFLPGERGGTSTTVPGLDASDGRGPNASFVGPGARVFAQSSHAPASVRDNGVSFSFGLRLSSFVCQRGLFSSFLSLNSPATKFFRPHHQPTLALLD